MLKSIATFTITMLLITPVASAAKAKKPKTETKTETKTEESAPAEAAATPAATTTTTTTVTAAPAASDTPAATTTTTTETTPTATGDHAWDATAGGVVANTWTLRLDLNTSLSPTLGAAYALNDMVEIGAAISAGLQDQMDFNVGSPVTLGYGPGIYAQLPIRFGLLHSGNHSLGVKVAPGLALFGFTRGLREVSLLIGAGVNYGYWVVPKTLLIGAGVDLFSAITLNPTVQYRAPILAGVTLEYNFHEHFGIFGEAKVGPMFDTFRTFAWSQRILFGLAAHL